MQNQGRLAVDHDLSSLHVAQSGLVGLSVGHDDRVVALGYLDGLEIGTAIEDDVDIVPRIASGMVLQSEGHEAVLGGEKLQVLA